MLVYAHKSNDDDSYNTKLAKIFTVLMCSSFCAAFFSAKHSDAIHERIRQLERRKMVVDPDIRSVGRQVSVETQGEKRLLDPSLVIDSTQ